MPTAVPFDDPPPEFRRSPRQVGSADSPGASARRRLRLLRYLPRLRGTDIWFVLLAGAGFVLILAVHGYMPGQSPPAIQANLGAGAAECVRRLGWQALTQVCYQAGLPVGQPFLTGLTENYAAGFLAHVPLIDSWTAHLVVDALCALLGYCSMIVLLQRWGAYRLAALGASFAYFTSLTMIFINGYTFTFNAFLLLPFHALVVMLVLERFRRGTVLVPLAMLIGSALLAVFTDGYGFIEIFLLNICVVAWWCKTAQAPLGLRIRGLGLFVLSSVLAAAVYVAYAPGDAYSANPSIGFFRSMGADVLTLIVPQRSLLWTNALGIGLSPTAVWGDINAYQSNYLGFAILGLTIWLVRRPGLAKICRPLASAGVLALLLALGPSLKINDFRPSGDAPPVSSYEMPAAEATISLPFSPLFTALPGLKDMRATYRWIVVTDFTLLSCGGLAISKMFRSGRKRAAAVIGLVALLELAPSYREVIDAGYRRGTHLADFKQGPLADLKTVAQVDDRILFLPASDDFLAATMVPFTAASSFNTGIDKNMFYAFANWPAAVTAAKAAYDTPNEADAVAAVLREDATVVVFPGFDLYSGALDWTSKNDRSSDLESRTAAYKADGRFQVQRTHWYLLVRLLPSA